MTTANGTISDTYTYDAFGDLISSVGTTPNNYLYIGQQYDPNLGFYYLRARYLNPATGRFWTRDSFEGDTQDPLSLHKYLYAINDPIDNIDLSGFGFTSAFGYIAHAKIEAIYVADHPGQTVIAGTTRGLLGTLLKPDILNVTSQSFAEIKPLSISGVAKGIVQLGAYSLAFGIQGYSPDVSWQPSTHLASVGDEPIFFFNVGGLVFYTDAVQNEEQLLALTSIQAVRVYLKVNQAVLERGLVESLARARVLINTAATADTVSVEDDIGTATLLGELGGFAF